MLFPDAILGVYLLVMLSWMITKDAVISCSAGLGVGASMFFSRPESRPVTRGLTGIGHIDMGAPPVALHLARSGGGLSGLPTQKRKKKCYAIPKLYFGLACLY
jgi:hypothetical protein